MKTNQNYQAALDAAQKGYIISRDGWNGKGLRVFVQVPSEVPENIIPKMSSLPPAVKTLLVHRGGSIRYQKQAALIYPDGTIEGWSPSLSDTMATDWVIHEEPHMEFTAAPVAETAGTAKPLTAAVSASASLPFYQCHKLVQAMKIGRIEGLQLFDAEEKLPPVKVGPDYMVKHQLNNPGYYVRYSDGYESWSPAKAFEEGYTLCEKPTTFKERVIAEHKELCLKLAKLNQWLHTTAFTQLPPAEQERQRVQYNFMEGYVLTLDARIAADFS